MAAWSAATLRIFSDKLEAEKIGTALNQNPSRTIKKNDPLSRLNPDSRQYTYNAWIMESGINSEDPLESHVNALVNFLEQKKDEVTALTKDCELSIFCGISIENHGGIHLSSDIIKRLSAFPVDLLFDVYD